MWWNIASIKKACARPFDYIRLGKGKDSAPRAHDDYGLIYFTLWTYIFPMMTCPMGMIIRLWDK